MTSARHRKYLKAGMYLEKLVARVELTGSIVDLGRVRMSKSYGLDPQYHDFFTRKSDYDLPLSSRPRFRLPDNTDINRL